MEIKEKMMALKMLKAAVDSVDNALEAIEDFAEKFGIEPEERKVDLYELTEIVAGETGMKKSCVFDVLTCAFDLIKDLKLTLVVEEDEDDDE